MFQSISIKNLRAITELKIDNFGQVNLFVGDNNCGKTTVLEALFLLIGATNPHLPVNINGLRGLPFIYRELWPTFFRNMDVSLPIEIVGQSQHNQEQHTLNIKAKFEKEIESKPVEPGSDIISLKVGNGETSQNVLPNGLILSYSNSERPEINNISEVFEKNNKVEFQGKKDIPFQGEILSPNQALEWKNKFALVQRKKRIPEVLSLLQKIEPNITDLRLNEVGLLEVDIGHPRLIPVNLMGGGVLKYLSVALAMLNYKDGIVLIDEIENGLHHYAQQTLWQAVFSWAQKLNVQVFAATHSYECIKAFRNSMTDSLFESEAKLYRIERKDENFKSIEFNPDELARFLEKNWEMR